MQEQGWGVVFFLATLAAACAALVLGAAVLAGCAGGGDQKQGDANQGGGDAAMTLTVGFDQSYPPYGFVGDDGVHGIRP